VAATCATIFSGCAGQRAVQTPAETGAAQVTATGQALPPSYRVGALDEIEIRVKFHDRLNDLAKVRPDGRITLPEVGDLYVAGLSTPALDSAITAAYAPLVHDPEVTVFVRNFGNLAVYVFGEVKSPGLVDLKPRMTVMQALVAASGPIRGAKLSNVVLLRRDPSGEVQAKLLNMDRSSIPQGGIEDAYVQPEDIIFVPKTFLATVNEFLTQFYDGVFPPFDIYLRTLREYNRN
jgi:protein involved in polysaccharide export with SLBB domain